MKFKLTTLLALCLALALGGLDAVTPAEAATAKKASAKRKGVPAKKASQAEPQDSDNLLLKSSAVVVQDQASGEVLFENTYTRALIELGYTDTMARREEVRTFLGLE